MRLSHLIAAHAHLILLQAKRLLLIIAVPHAPTAFSAGAISLSLKTLLASHAASFLTA